MYRYINLLCLLLIIGCSLKSSSDSLKEKTADGLYANGKSLMRAGNYSDAATTFKDIETLFPYSSKASNGQILSAYCYFMSSNYLDATRELDVFLKYHPSHNLVPYAMYLRAICAYMQVLSAGRDSRIAHDAKQLFVEIANRFPDSAYHSDASKKILILNDIIASNEMFVGRYYQKRKNTLAAVSRYNFIVSHLPHTSEAAEAYYRIIECCEEMGLKAEAASAYHVLKNNFPNSKWEKLARNVNITWKKK